jgi:integrase/recombinase XerD
MAVKNFSEHTIQLRRIHMNRFVRWAAERDVTRPSEVTRPMVERYQKHLFYFRHEKDRRLGFRAQHSHLTSLRSWMKWLARYNHILYNPAAELELPRIGSHLPKQVLSPKEAESILNQTNVREALGLRDRAIMEMLYTRVGIKKLQQIHAATHPAKMKKTEENKDEDPSTDNEA